MAVWVPLRNLGLLDLERRLVVRQIVRIAWLAIAIAGLTALIDDIRAITI